MTDEELDYYVEMDGCDPDTGEELPEQYELNENIIQGDVDAKQIVKDTYKNIKSIYGRYIPHYSRLYSWHYILIYIVLLGFIAAAVGVTIATKRFPYILLVAWAFCIAVIIMLKFSFKYDFIFYKTKRKTVVVYKRKNIIHICLGKDDLFKFKFNKWKKEYDGGQILGSRPVFSKVVGKLSMKKKKDKLKIVSGKGDAYLEFKNNQLVSMAYRPIAKYDLNCDTHSFDWQKIFINEINTNRYVEIPKSFIDFCKEQGIEPPEECEHLHYV